MIHSRNLHDESKPYLTEFTNGREGVESVISDSSAMGGANMSPSELLQAALAGCTNMTARELLDERGIPFDDIFVDVSVKSDYDNSYFPAATARKLAGWDSNPRTNWNRFTVGLL